MDLLERDGDLATLEIWWREAVAGQGRLVFLGGESGVGKSSLVNAFCARASRPVCVLRGACEALSTPPPLGPLYDIADDVRGELDRVLTKGGSRDQVFRAVLALLCGASTPTIVVIEDAHWADDATLDLLRYLGRRMASSHALLVVTYRDEEIGSTHPLRLVMGDLATAPPVRRLHLAPLSEEGIRTLAAGSHLDPVVLHRLTGGNPFYATETLADAAAANGMIPATVRDAVLARASRLTLAGREALEAAAVIGSPIGTDLLAEVARASDAAIEECLTRGMLVDIGKHALAFRHELARVAIRDAILPLRRRELHRRVLAKLASGPDSQRDLALLAHHAEAAGDGAAVLRFAPDAARRAAALCAHRESASQFSRALRFAAGQPPAARAELIESLSYEYYLTLRPTEAIALRREALEIWRAIGDQRRVGDALRWVSRFAWFAGRTNEATAAAEEAIAILETLPPGRELAMAFSNRSQLYMLANEADAAIAWGERAIALAATLGETEIQVHALNNVGTARMKTGDQRGRMELERSLDLALRDDMEEHVARAYTNLSWTAVHQYDVARADTYFAAGISYTADHDLDAWRLYMRAWQGYLYVLTGEWDCAIAAAREVLAMPNVGPLCQITASLVEGLMRARRGLPGADESLARALALAEPTGELQRLGPVRIARMEAAWLVGDNPGAAAEARAVVELTLLRGSPWDVGALLVWLKRAGQLDVIGPLPGTAALPAPFQHELAGEWSAAAAAWEALGCPYDAALALLGGDEPAIRQAHTIFERIGAGPAAARAALHLRSLGSRVIRCGPRQATRANPAQLTGRELEILPFIAAGRSNIEIADRLFISAKTVDHHVGSILTKLGVHSRHDVAKEANALGIRFLPDQDRVLAPAK